GSSERLEAPARKSSGLIHIRPGSGAACSRAPTRAPRASISLWSAWKGCPGGTPGGVTPGLPFGAASADGAVAPTTNTPHINTETRLASHVEWSRIVLPLLV